MNAYCVIGAENISVNKTVKNPCPYGTFILLGEGHENKINVLDAILGHMSSGKKGRDRIWGKRVKGGLSDDLLRTIRRHLNEDF